ncbi:MAG TPA: hypothetical protein VEX39_16880 [Thermoleophilaceae bacterium]|nr:hypothetical protein [Thermoleophilaceae bacterium]
MTQAKPGRGMSIWLFSFRYAIPAALVLFGLVYAIVDWPVGAEAFSLFAGAGLSIVLLNVLFRIGLQGDAEREQEQSARDHFTEHGVWPDDQPKAQRGWKLPEGVATPESEAEEARRADGAPGS